MGVEDVPDEQVEVALLLNFNAPLREPLVNVSETSLKALEAVLLGAKLEDGHIDIVASRVVGLQLRVEVAKNAEKVGDLSCQLLAGEGLDDLQHQAVEHLLLHFPQVADQQVEGTLKLLGRGGDQHRAGSGELGRNLLSLALSQQCQHLSSEGRHVTFFLLQRADVASKIFNLCEEERNEELKMKK